MALCDFRMPYKCLTAQPGELRHLCSRCSSANAFYFDSWILINEKFFFISSIWTVFRHRLRLFHFKSSPNLNLSLLPFFPCSSNFYSITFQPCSGASSVLLLHRCECVCEANKSRMPGVAYVWIFYYSILFRSRLVSRVACSSIQYIKRFNTDVLWYRFFFFSKRYFFRSLCATFYLIRVCLFSACKIWLLLLYVCTEHSVIAHYACSV